MNVIEERISKMLVRFIDLEIKHSKNEFYVQELSEIKNEFLKEPTQPEGYQGLNEWYLLKCNGTRVDYYGFVNLKDGYFRCSYFYIKGGNFFTEGGAFDLAVRELTESEIKEAILKGCEQKGIVEGARVKCLDNNCLYNINFVRAQYEKSENQLWLCSDLHDVDVCVFDNGNFAEVVKDEKEKYRLGRKQQRAILETQTGKEYLLFPQGHEDTAKCFLRYLNGGDLSKNELIKIIGSLNKPSVNMIDCDEAKKLKELLKECETLLTGIFNGSSYISEIDPLLVKLKKHLNND